MKQNRVAFLLMCMAVFLASPEAGAQSPVDGQPSVLKEDNGQSNYVYDLKLLIKKSKDNIKGVNEKIKEQAIIKRNQQREEKAREYYEQALKLQEEGRLEEARQLFDKAIRITEHPEMKYYIKESERRSKLQKAALQREETDQERRANEEQKLLMERAEDSYQMAVTLYKQQKFREAKDEFTVVEELYPDYKAVRSYLQIVEQDIIQSERLDMKEQNKEIERQQKEEEIARLREKELWRKEVEKKEEERQQQLRKQAQGVYEEALRLFDERKYAAARDKFQEVEWVVPDYKATRAYLTRIENGIDQEKKELMRERQRELEKQRWQDALGEKKTAEEQRKVQEQRSQAELLQVKDQAEFVYVAAVALFEKDLMEQAREKFEEVNTLYPKYKSTEDYLKRIDQVSRERADREALKKKEQEERRIWEEEMNRRKEERERFKVLASEANIFYQDALALYQTGRLIEAKEKFLSVDERVPDYKSTRSYLKRIDQDIELMVKTQDLQRSLADERAEIEKMKMMRDKAETVYARAVRAYDAKDFALAREKFLETEKIYPDYKKTKYYLNRIDEDIRLQEEMNARAAREKQAEAVYGDALVSYQMGQFEDAKKQFLTVETILPNYKKTPEYLGRIDDDILKKKEADLMRMKEDRVKSLYDQAMVLYQNGDLSEAKDKLFQVEVVYPGYKETTKTLAAIDAEIQKMGQEVLTRQEMQEAERLYNEALALYQSRDYAGAKQKFIKTEVAYSNYKDCLKYLSRIDADIERKRQEDERALKAEQAEPLYAEGVAFYKNADFLEAKKKFLAAQVLIDGYKDTALYLKRLEKDIRDQEERLAREEKMRQCDLLYGDAVKLHMYRRFVEAKEKFLALAAIDPSYKNVKGYLARINDDIRKEAELQARLLVEQQVVEPYMQGVTLYHDGDLKAAKEMFAQVVGLIPDYKKAKFYLSRIEEDLRVTRKAEDRDREARAEALYKEAALLMADDRVLEAHKKFCDVQSIYPDYKSVRVNIERLRKIGAEKGLELPAAPVPVPEVSPEDEKAASLYKEAVQLYKDKKYGEAADRFASVMKIKPGYRSAQKYLDSINELKDLESKGKAEKKRAEAKAAVESEVIARARAREEARMRAREVLEAKRKKARESEAAIKAPARAAVKAQTLSPRDEAQAIAKLSARSDALYQQIRSLSEDKELSDASRTFAQVDRLMEKLDAENRRLAEQREREKKIEEVQHRAAYLKDQAREAQLKNEDLYQQALLFYREKDYASAREALLQLEKTAPDYKDSAKLFARMDRAEEEARLVAEEERDREAVKRLADKAMAINLEILDLSRKKDYLSVEQRFNDLEGILKEIETAKARIVDRRSDLEGRWKSRAIERRAIRRTGISAHVVKENEDFVATHAKARAIYKEGQQLYAAQHFPEARVKFMDALDVDPSFKAAMSYVKRIDRILLKRDFEVSRAQEKARPGAPKGRDDMADADRAADVAVEGVRLYQARRYREARIKFEELVQVGSAADRQKATRYLGLIEEALEKEKRTAEADKLAQKGRYLEEQSARAKLDWDTDKKQQKREVKKTRERVAAQRELDIRRQQELRAIEEENLRQRRDMLEKKSSELARALRDEQQERARFSAKPARDKSSVNAAVAEEMARQEKILAARAQAGDRAAAADTEEFIRRNQQEVEAILKDAPVVPETSAPVPSGPQVIPPAPALLENEDPSALLLKQAVAQEKQILEEQRTAIRKDFEQGVERLYNEAIALFRKKMYAEAREDFEQVDALIKGYKKTEQYLKDIERLSSRSAR